LLLIFLIVGLSQWSSVCHAAL